VELGLSVFARRFLKRGDCCSVQDFATRLDDYLEVYNTHQAQPYRWTYPGQPLVRATRSASHGINNGTGERGVALSPHNVGGLFIRPGRISGPRHDWQRTYETDI
jgi:hypothetical protein